VITIQQGNKTYTLQGSMAGMPFVSSQAALLKRIGNLTPSSIYPQYVNPLNNGAEEIIFLIPYMMYSVNTFVFNVALVSKVFNGDVYATSAVPAPISFAAPANAANTSILASSFTVVITDTTNGTNNNGQMVYTFGNQLVPALTDTTVMNAAYPLTYSNGGFTIGTLIGTTWE